MVYFKKTNIQKKSEENLIIKQNKKISHFYELKDKFIAGIVLTGIEIKSIRKSKVSIDNVFIKISKKKEAYAYGIKIYNEKNNDNTKELKLLLKKSEINDLTSEIKKKKLICIVSKLFIKSNKWAKLELFLAKRKKKFELKEKLKKKEKKILLEN